MTVITLGLAYRDCVRAIEDARTEFKAAPETFVGGGRPSPEWLRHCTRILGLQAEMIRAKEALFRELDRIESGEMAA